MTVSYHIDRLPAGSDELPVVASRMRDTLIEVLGEEVGKSMYSLSWTLDRAVSHVDGRLPGAVYVARHGPDGLNVGHVIVRQERDERGEFGLISTIYVLPEVRHKGVATMLLDAAHDWFADRDLQRTATDTSETNRPLIALFERHGYECIYHSEEKRMVRLGRERPRDR